jgi:hypothetical protein
MATATSGCDDWLGGDDRQPVKRTTRFWLEVSHQNGRAARTSVPSERFVNGFAKGYRRVFCLCTAGRVRNDRSR